MKISQSLALMIFFMLICVYAHCEDYMDEKTPLATPYMKEKSDERSDLSAPKDTAKVEVKVDAGEKVLDLKQIKAQSICIGKECRNQWPSFKCANYEGRPAGETGDEFCSQMNQVCVATSIGGGQSFFDECSVAANSVHKCRCCWVE